MQRPTSAQKRSNPASFTITQQRASASAGALSAVRLGSGKPLLTLSALGQFLFAAMELSMATRADHDVKENRQTSRQLAQAIGKVIALVLIAVLVLLVERYCQVEVPPFGPGAKLVAIDGDSLRASNGTEYRLFGIDAPELHQTCKEVNGTSWLCGRAAKAKLTTIIKRGNVNCEARAKDRFDRIVAVCSAEGVPDIAGAMVRDGYALVLGFATGNYQAAQVEAEVAKRGIWRGSFDLPAAWRAANPRAGE